tara:strand:+ start:894 stop:1040 length:147 start_codon:yes stop_codon:yes gene_type:complete
VRREAGGELLHQGGRLKAFGAGALLLRGRRICCAALELGGQQVGKVGL